MSGHDDPAPAGSHHLIEMPPAFLRNIDGCLQQFRRGVRNLEQIDEITGAGSEYPASDLLDLLVCNRCAQHLGDIRSDIPAVGGKERVHDIAAAIGDPVGETPWQNPNTLAQQPGTKYAESDLKRSSCWRGLSPLRGHLLAP